LKLSFLWWLPFGKVPEIDPQTFHRWLEAGKAVQIVDARTSLEFNQGTIEDARHAPLTEMPGSMKTLDLDKDTPVVVLCSSGHRSRPGTRWLRARNIEAYSLKGGVSAWERAGYPLNPPRDP